MNVLDIFSGSGGFSQGFDEAGLTTKYAVEIDRFACETFSENFKNTKVFCKDVSSFKNAEIKRTFKNVEIIIGGPPCQGFSVAGPRQYGIEDDRNKLVYEMVRFSEIIDPRVCIIENVPGLIRTTKKNPIYERLIKNFRNLGYQENVFLLDSKYYGVPQSRKRAFLIFIKDSKNKLNIPTAKSYVSVYEAISDLDFDEMPFVESNLKYTIKPINAYQRLMRKNSKHISNHVPMQHTRRLIERFKAIKVGQSLKDVPQKFGQRRRGTNEIDVKKRFKMNNQRLDPNKYSLAITASFQSNFVHPFRHRNLTAREGARLMSYPDKFKFCGPRTLMSKSLLKREGRESEIGLSQYNQIGNSVPPMLGKSIAQAILEHGIFK